jgi:hypothetical protein
MTGLLLVFWVITVNPILVTSISDAVFPSVKPHFMKMHCSFKSAIRKSWLTYTTVNTKGEATQRIMVSKLTRLTQDTVLIWHLVAEKCTT